MSDLFVTGAICLVGMHPGPSASGSGRGSRSRVRSWRSTRSWLRVLAAGGVLAATGCMMPLDTESGQQAALLAPATPFHPFLCQDQPAFDPHGDRSGGESERDIVGRPTNEGAALYYASGAGQLYLRVRLDDDPRASGGADADLAPHGWAFLFDTIDRDTVGVPEYERMIIMNGLEGKDVLAIRENVVPDEDDIGDKAEGTILRYDDDVSEHWRVDRACDALVSSACFGDDDDYFLTIEIEWADLERTVSRESGTLPSMHRGVPTRLWTGTTASPNSDPFIDLDIACNDDARASHPLLSAVPADKVVFDCDDEMHEGERGCDGPPQHDPGAEGPGHGAAASCNAGGGGAYLFTGFLLLLGLWIGARAVSQGGG